MTLNRLAKEGRARRDGQVWFPFQRGVEMEDDGATPALKPRAFG